MPDGGATIGWAIALALGVPAALGMLLNWVSFSVFLWNRYVHRRPGDFSFCPPLLAGIAGSLACLVCPWPDTWRWAWAALLLDPSISVWVVSLVLHLTARATGLRSPWA